MSCDYHSEIDHEEVYGGSRSVPDRDFNEDDYEFGVERTGSLWTFVSCPDEEERYPSCSTAHNNAIVIAVDGACRNNGTSWAKAAIGVFVHRNNYWNEASVMDDDETHTNQRAELYAGLSALRIAQRIRVRNLEPRPAPAGPYRRLRRVVIKSDSAYLVISMTDWIYKWRNNGYINSRGLPVCNGDLFTKLEEAVEELNILDVQIQFWRVPRVDNAVADCLANAALDGISEDDALDAYFDD